MSEEDVGLFDYDLPPELIAQRPAEAREDARLLVLHAGQQPRHCSISDLPEILTNTDLIVRNNTRVIPARLRGARSHGGKTELLLIHRLLQSDAEEWLCLGRPASHLKRGCTITFGDGSLVATIVENRGKGEVVARFNVPDMAALLTALDRFGEVPLPPYIERDQAPDAEDRKRYQTTFATKSGAVAAPTAGLHFTADLDLRLRARGVEIVELTLHVGPGTFRPIIAEKLSDHQMDEEYYEISEETASAISAARSAGRRIIAVGTTSTRTLETVTDAHGVSHAGSGWSRLFIRPGYRFKAIDGLLTNFHLPKSSLLVLVSALAGRVRILDAYREAVEERYRFYSYGDAMLLL